VDEPTKINGSSYEATKAEYEGIICDACKQRLNERFAPIHERLERGKKPSKWQTMKLMDCLCHSCLNKVMIHERRKAHGRH